MKRSLLVLAFVLAGALVSRRADAHIVPVGVGTQTQIDIRPRKILVNFDLGFSSLLGLQELRSADADKDGKISHDEERAYLERTAARVLPQLHFHWDGKPLELRLVDKQGLGIAGEIAAVNMDAVFQLEADVPATPGSHELTYYEGTYENEVSQQILYVVTERGNDFGTFELEQKRPGPPPMETQGVLALQGRDVTIKYEFLPRTLERDRAEELVEPSMKGLQATVDDLATKVARSTEKDLSSLPLGEVRLGAQEASIAMKARRGFRVSAPMAGDRSGGTRGDATAVRNEQNQLADDMLKKVREPFTIAALLVFLLWGAAHALAPGHGKTMVAAYLLGTKGRVWDAVRLGFIVTFTHTFVVYTLGLGLVVLVDRMKLTQASQDAVNQRAVFMITVVSGVGLALFGAGLAWRRRQSVRAREHAHEHAHAPVVLEAPKTGKRLGLVSAAPVEVAPVHDHGHGPHTHTHDGPAHSHEGMSEDEHAALHAREASVEITSLKALLLLGIGGGIVPCPAGVVLIVGSIGLHLSALNTFIYLVSFSLGLGGVLVAIATVMVLSRRFLDRALSGERSRVLEILPVASAIAIVFIGFGIVYSAYDPAYAKLRAYISSAASARAR